MRDIFAGITSTFANELLSSHSYPLVLHFEEKNFDGGNPLEPVFLEGEPVAMGQVSEFDVDESSESLLDTTIESFVYAIASNNSALRRGPLSEIERDLINLYKDPVGDETIDLPNGSIKKIVDLTDEDIKLIEQEEALITRGWFKKLWKKIKDAAKKVADVFVKKFQEFLKKYFRFTTLWTEFKILSKPTAKAGNPIELSKVDLKVRVKIEACIKIFKWRCADVTTDWVHLKAGRVLYDLTPTGLVLYGKPRVEDMTLIISINIFGYKFDIEIGITDFVNKQLKKQKSDKIWDASDFDITVETLRRKFVPKKITAVGGADFFEGDVEGDFQPV